MTLLTSRWTKLNYHPVQQALWKCNSRFIVNPAGRRSGKTELAKRRLIKQAISYCDGMEGRFIFSAPTHSQARDIYWSDIKAMVPNIALKTPKKPWKSISESACTMILWSGAKIIVAGMDKPERIEGPPIIHIVLDEFGNMKEKVWVEHVRPALSTIGMMGSAHIIGVPEGRNHYYHIAKQAQINMKKSDKWEDSWSYFHWPSSDVLPDAEIKAAKRDLDELTYRQEYEASFVNFTGRAYHAFDEFENVKLNLPYDKQGSLVFCFDFNVEPGTATILQEHDIGTCVIGEVYIPRNSNTEKVCSKLISMYGKHEGSVLCYGDATGGARGSAKVTGSDWAIIYNRLHPVFGDRLFIRVGKSNPRERDRLNAVNSRCKNVFGERRLFVDSVKCPKTREDFEGTILLEGGSGEIDKRHDPMKSHLTDGIGYYIIRRWPVGQRTKNEENVVGILNK